MFSPSNDESKPCCPKRSSGTFPPDSSLPPPLPRLAYLIPSGNALPVFRSQQEETLLLCDRKKKIRLLAEIDGQIDDLIRKRTRLQQDLAQYKAIFDPVRRLSVEVLQEIFIQALPRDTDSGYVCNSLKPLQAPWNVSQVSQRWRDAALTFPALWSEVGIEWEDSFINVGSIDRDMERRKRLSFVSQLSLQLTRSRALDLTMSFTAMDLRRFTDDHPILPILILTASRWKELSWNVSPSYYHHFLPLRDLLFHLKSLSVHITEVRDNWPINSFWGSPPGLDIFRSATQLKSVVISSPALRHLDLPWKKLQSFEYKPRNDQSHSISDSSDWAASVLSQGVSLKAISFPSHLKAASLLSRESHVRIDKLSLTYATAEIDRPFGPDRILGLLNLPALKCLTIDFTSTASDVLTAISSFLKRSQCKIKEIRLRNTVSPSATDDLLSFLEELVHVEVLELDMSELTSEGAPKYLDRLPILDRLLNTSVKEETAFLPCLRRFRLTSSRQLPRSQFDKLNTSRPNLYLDLRAPHKYQGCPDARGFPGDALINVAGIMVPQDQFDKLSAAMGHKPERGMNPGKQWGLDFDIFK